MSRTVRNPINSVNAGRRRCTRACVAAAFVMLAMCCIAAPTARGQSDSIVPAPDFEASGKRIRNRLGDLGSAGKHRFGLTDSFTVEAWVSGGVPASGEAILFANKRSGSKGRGWAIFAQPIGPWQWRCSNGERHVAYVPYRRQKITDNRRHQLLVSVDRRYREIRAYFDGRAVAVLDATGLGDLTGRGNLRASALLERAAVWQRVLTPKQVDARYHDIVGDEKRAERNANAAASAELKIASFNIQDGGRTLGDHKGVNYVIDVLRQSRADVICLQESSGSAARIADGLGFTVYLRGDNVAILSRYPIERSCAVYDGTCVAAVRVRLPAGRTALVCSVCVDDERTTDVTALLDAIEAVRKTHEPVIVAGDFKAPSHLDAGVAPEPAGPASQRLERAGYVDCYRAVYADAATHRGLTWPVAKTAAREQRIDFVYCRGRAVKPVAAGILDEHENAFPSDHAAIWATVRVSPPK